MRLRWSLAVAVLFVLVVLFLGRVEWSVPTGERVVFLTFDDGPNEVTLLVLDVLAEENVSATFFLVGERVEENPATVRRILAEGHALGVHGMTHRALWWNASAEMEGSVSAVEAVSGEPVWLFRPPYGVFTPSVVAAAHRLGLRVVLWDVFPRDYTARDPDVVVRRVLQRAHPGAIIVLHDGPGKREVLLEALPRIIRGLREEGYVFRTLPEQ